MAAYMPQSGEGEWSISLKMLGSAPSSVGSVLEWREKMQRIGVVSDTHGRLRGEVIDILKGCSQILHAGDINTPKVLERLKEIAPVCAVRGNADKEWAKALPETLDEEICGLRIFMVHNKKELPADLSGYDLVIYGHSHKYEEREGACFYLNPGSCGSRRFSLPVTMAVVEVEDDGTFRVVKKDIVDDTDRKPRENMTADKAGLADRRPDSTGQAALTEKTLSMLLQDVDKGKSVSKIAAKYQIEEEMAEQICRLYLTHPGITAAGVLEKMALPKDR